MTGHDDKVYYETNDQLGITAGLIARARRRMLEDFLQSMTPVPGEPILDIGVSDEITDEANFIEKHYTRREDITCAGLGDGRTVLAAYPGVKYRQIAPNAPLPFSDKSFAIATCNAVLEHVGGEAERGVMVADMLRVARKVFVAVPNRWFPVEHHTSIPLLHYCPPVFRTACKPLGKSYWADSRNLDFLSLAALKSLFPAEARPRAWHSGLMLGPFSSNIVCVANAD